MKKNILTLVVLMFSLAVFAGNPNGNSDNYTLKNTGNGAKCFDANTHIINVGIGGGFVSGVRYSKHIGHLAKYRALPVFNISYEQPWSKKIGPGYLGVGGYFAFKTVYNSYYDYHVSGVNYYYKNRWSDHTLTGRAVYHWDVLNSEKAEVYGGVLIGMRFQHHKISDNNPYNNIEEHSETILLPALSLFAGARYYFSEKFGVYAELRAGAQHAYLSYYDANIGLSFKF